jgi:hypothetical protein
MTIVARLQKLVPDLARTIGRFPGPVIASLFSCVVANLQIAERNSAADNWYEHLLWAGAAAFIASGAVHLFAEAAKWRKPANFAAATTAGIVIALLYWFDSATGLHRLFFFVGLVLLLMCAAYVRASADQAAFWMFNLRLGLAALLAVLVGVAACGGLTAILKSLEFLFEIKIPSSLYNHVWATGATLISPLYGLSLTPHSLDEQIELGDYRDSALERGVSVLVNYVLVPIVLIYAAILYAYAIKIGISWTLPKGQIGTLVSIFALVGTATYLISFPWQEQGARLLRWFSSSWFLLTLVPAALLVIGTARRIGEYGVTPDRYALVTIAVWLVGLAAYFTLRRKPIDIRYIVGGFAALILLGSIGPWGARATSARDQYGRLEQLLSQYGFLKNGKLADPLPSYGTIPAVQRVTASSIIHLLVNEGEQERLRPWLAGRSTELALSKDEQTWSAAEKLIAGLGLQPANHQRIDFNSNAPSSFAPPAGSIVVGPVTFWSSQQVSADLSRIEDKGATLAIRHGQKTWILKTSDLLAKAADMQKPSERSAPFSMPVEGPQGKIELIVKRVTGELSEETVKLQHAEIWFILQQ